MGFHPGKWFAGIAKRRRILFVSIAWILGILFGCIFATAGGDTYCFLLQNASHQSVSLPGLMVNVIMPFATVLIANRLGSYWLATLAIFIKMTFVTACSAGLHFVYGDADWLVRLFVQFSDLLTLPVLCWLSLVSATKPISKRAAFTVSLWYISVCLIDYCVISPFFAGLIVK